jgi:1A family penicillin-binding protein
MKEKPRNSLFRKFLKVCEVGIYISALIAASGAVILGVLFYTYSRNLPSLEPLQSYASTSGDGGRWSQSTQVLAIDGTVIGEFFEEDRVVIGIEQIPEVMRKAIIAVEDERFDGNHPQAWVRRNGIDPIGIVRAALVNIAAGKKVQGGSTITQQLAKNLFLTSDRTLKRKIQEILLAREIERRFSRDEILERYLNKVFFGYHAYGLASAAMRYYSVDLQKPNETLTLGQAAMLAGLAKAPSYYAPHRHPERAKERQRIVLRRMVDCGYIGADEIEPAIEEFWESFDKNLVTVPDADSGAVGVKVEHGGFFVEYVRRELLKYLSDGEIRKGGYRVQTTLDVAMQRKAEIAMQAGLARLTKDITARRISLAKGPLEGALVAIDHSNGHILAMVGGSQWSTGNQYNRAVQALRQAGSSFKPFVYFTALESNEATLGTVLRDQSFQVPGTDWTPRNYDGSQRGPVLPRYALTHSLNIAAVRMLLQTSGEKVLERAKTALGLDVSRMQPYPSMALGAFEVTLLQMVGAYSTWANAGTRVEPYPILSIVDRNGKVFKQFDPFPENRATTPEAAFLMTSILQSVVQRGTAASAVGAPLARARKPIPAAGKTGTTDDYADAWFVGYTPTITAGVWIGFDERRTMGPGMTGGRAAGTIWADFIKGALEGKDPGKFPSRPDNIVTAGICSLTGLIASQDCTNIIDEFFINQTMPHDFCEVHSDPALLQQFMMGDAEVDDSGMTIWPDNVSIGYDTMQYLIESRERLRAIIDAEAPRDPTAPLSPGAPRMPEDAPPAAPPPLP